MFDVGLSELLIISLVALLVFGPNRLPEVARTAGHWVGRIRRFMEDVKRDVDREINTEELAEFRKLQEELTQARSVIEAESTKTLELLQAPAVEEEKRPETAPAATAAVPVAGETKTEAGPTRPRRPRKPRTVATSGEAPARKPRARRKSAAGDGESHG